MTGVDRPGPSGILSPMETMSDAALEAEVLADETRLLPRRPLDTTSEYEFALIACYLIEGLAYLAKGSVDDFFQMGRVAGISINHATKLLGAELKIKDLVSRLPEVVVTLADREEGLGIRPSWAKRTPKPRVAKKGPYRNVTDSIAESQPETRGAHRHFVTLFLDCGHQTVRTMYESQRFANGQDNTPKYVRCDTCPAHYKSSPREKR